MTRSQFGRYQVLHKLGQGAMSAVFLARDPVLARLVAVKVVHADLMLQEEVVRRFFQEAKVAARSQSPYIVNVHDFGQAGKTPYLVMEFIDGQPLQKIMDYLGGEPLPPILAAALLCQAAEGVSIAAEAGIVHRDLKPANLMVSDKGYLKVTDFGICHLSDHTLTRTGQVLGSPRFMSPEQVRGIKPITPQADLFSLGAVLYYCLSGRPPFQAETPVDLYRQIAEEPHVPLESYNLVLDPFLIRLVDTLLEKDPAKRGQGPRWLRFQLKRFLHHQRVIDPAERVAVFIRDLSTQGFQTTSSLDRSAIRHYMGSLDLGANTLKPRRIWRWVAAGMVSIGIVVGGASIVPLVRQKSESPAGSISTASPKTLPVTRTGQKDLLESKTAIPTHSSHSIEPLSPSEKSESIPKSLQVREAEPRRAQMVDGDAVLSVYSVPPNALVSIDGYEYGRTPLEGRFLPAGTYRITLRTDRGTEVDTILELPGGPQVRRFVLGSPEALGK